jgi:hypothetical protein
MLQSRVLLLSMTYCHEQNTTAYLLNVHTSMHHGTSYNIHTHYIHLYATVIDLNVLDNKQSKAINAMCV